MGGSSPVGCCRGSPAAPEGAYYALCTPGAPIQVCGPVSFDNPWAMTQLYIWHYICVQGPTTLSPLDGVGSGAAVWGQKDPPAARVRRTRFVRFVVRRESPGRCWSERRRHGDSRGQCGRALHQRVCERGTPLCSILCVVGMYNGAHPLRARQRKGDAPDPCLYGFLTLRPQK